MYQEPETIHIHSWGAPGEPWEPFVAPSKLPRPLGAPAVVVDSFWFPSLVVKRVSSSQMDGVSCSLSCLGYTWHFGMPCIGQVSLSLRFDAQMSSHVRAGLFLS